MHKATRTLAAAALAIGVGGPAQGQTAADVNRLSAAIQICNSPAGATMAECARLRARPGFAGSPQAGAAGAGTTASLLDALNAAMGPRQPPVMTQVPAANPQAIAACVRAAGAAAAAVQACLAQAGAPRPPAPQAPGLGQPLLPAAQRNLDTATAIHQGGQSYQACAAANPTNWRSCLPLLNGGAPR